jgi:hypothetical protein
MATFVLCRAEAKQIVCSLTIDDGTRQLASFTLVNPTAWKVQLVLRDVATDQVITLDTTREFVGSERLTVPVGPRPTDLPGLQYEIRRF